MPQAEAPARGTAFALDSPQPARRATPRRFRTRVPYARPGRRTPNRQPCTQRSGLLTLSSPPLEAASCQPKSHPTCAHRLPTTNGVNRIDHTSRQRCPPTPLQHYLIPRQIALSSMELFLPKTVPNPAHVCSANCTASLFQRPVLLRPPLPGAPSPSMQQRDSPSLIRARVRV